MKQKELIDAIVYLAKAEAILNNARDSYSFADECDDITCIIDKLAEADINK